MILCYGSADGAALRAQALYHEKFPARRVRHSQTFLFFDSVYGKVIVFDQKVWTEPKSGRRGC
jgi:hypothetical protein